MEEIKERFDDNWNTLSDIVNSKGDTEAKIYLNSFIQSEIDLAVSKERERIVENLKNPYSVVIPTQDGLAEWAILEHGKRMGFERAVKELNTFINTK